VAALTAAATWHLGLEFGRELPLHLSVCDVTCAKERYKLMWSVAPIHVEYFPQTSLVRLCSCLLLRSQVVHLRFMKPRTSGTNGTMPYESKYYALEDLGRKCMASQCEPSSVWGSTLTMTVQVFVIEHGRSKA